MKQHAAKVRSQRSTVLVAALACLLAASNGTVRAGELDRYELASQLLDQWQPIAVELGESAITWREMFTTQFALMDLSSLRDIAAVKADTGTAKASYEAFAQAFRNAVMQAHLTAQTAKGQPKLGSLTTDQVFIPITPCRVVDTRNVGGPINAGTARNFYYYAQGASGDWGTQGGPPGGAGTTCPGTVNPGGGVNGGAPSAAAATVTVVGPSGAGNFVAWGGASPVPLTSVLNWVSAGTVLANTTIIPEGGRAGSGPGGSIADFAIYYNGPSGSAQVVVDVVGYFVQNTATPLSCVQINSGDVAIPPNSGLVAADASCPTGYTLTGGGFYVNEGSTGVINDWLWTSYPVTPNTWRTNWSNQTGGSRNGRTYAVCCRVPGK